MSEYDAASVAFETGGGMLIAGPHVRPSSVERLISTVGTTPFGRIGIDETIQTPCARS